MDSVRIYVESNQGLRDILLAPPVLIKNKLNQSKFVYIKLKVFQRGTNKNCKNSF